MADRSPAWTRKVACFLLAVSLGNVARAASWETYRHDNARSGVTTEQLTLPLSPVWTFEPAHAPRPAWMSPAEELPRAHFDSAYHVTAADGRVYFGSSVDNKVYALDIKRGEVAWTFYTEGPVRFAPTVSKGRVYVGSDDGHAYCLDAHSGKLIWKYRGGASGEKVIGNGRMISLWPVRTSVLVADDVVYFAAGVFPYEGTPICALRANDGKVIWKNDTIGDHSHELAYGGISPQSYLVASDTTLYVPSGRAMPAAFERKSGRFLYYCSPNGKVGGTWALLQGDELIAGVERSGTPAKVAYDRGTGKRRGDAYAWFPGRDMVVTPAMAYTLTEDGIYGINRAKYPALARKGGQLSTEQKALEKTRVELKKKFRKADEEARKKLTAQFDEAGKKIKALAAKQKRLRDSAYMWKYVSKDLDCLILVGKTLFAGGEEKVVAVDAATGEECWRGTLAGQAQGLAVADGNLLVSTNKGPIYCFRQGEGGQVKVIRERLASTDPVDPKLAALCKAAAEKIVKETGVTKGYCLVLGCGTGRLAEELAKRTDLKIVGIEQDATKVAAAKRHLDAAGLYGSRVVVESWAISDLPQYFANLIVSEETMVSGKVEEPAGEMFGVLRPYGGVAYFGQPTGILDKTKTLDLEKLRGWLAKSGAADVKVSKTEGVWAKATRGTLAGAGSWTNLYGNPQNTSCSEDQLVKCPLGVLWFGEPGPKPMVERHGRAPSPLSIDGRLFVQGEEIVMAYDAYNGTSLWERRIPGAVRTRVDVDRSNLTASQDGLYVAAHDKCYRLDPATGKTVRVYEFPASEDGSPRRWGYVACTGKLLLGSAAMPLKSDYGDMWKNLVADGGWKSDIEVPEQYKARWQALKRRHPKPTPMTRAALHRAGAFWRGITDFPSWQSQQTPKGARTPRMMVSDVFFAFEADSGKLLWTHRGKKIAHITATVGNETLFFAEGKVTAEQRQVALGERQTLIKAGKYEEGGEKSLTPEERDVRLLVAVDVKTGSTLWEKPMDVTGCGGDKMGGAYRDGVLTLFGHFSNHDTRFFRRNSLTWRRIAALDAKTGDVLWSRPLNYLRRPLIVGDTIIIEPRACDLRTGKIKTRSHPITGKPVPWEFLRPGHCCSITSASASALFYRSFNLAIYDLAEDQGITLFGGIRPGCWLNMVAAGGVMLMPESSSGCTCSFPIKCSVAMVHKGSKRPRAWSVFVANNAVTPAKHLAVNLGAPGDMRDDQGRMWFGYPRPKAVSGIGYGPYGVKFKLQQKVLDGMGFFERDFKGAQVAGTDKPWLFTSGALGLSRCDLPLMDESKNPGSGLYTVRLGFLAPEHDQAGQRVFDVKLQGKTVAKDLDIVKAAGGPNKAIIKEFNRVAVTSNLTIELVPKTPNPTNAQAPVINFIEAIRDDARKASAAAQSQ